MVAARSLPVRVMMLMVGVKRVTSDCQLVETEVGATTSDGPSAA